MNSRPICEPPASAGHRQAENRLPSLAEEWSTLVAVSSPNHYPPKTSRASFRPRPSVSHTGPMAVSAINRNQLVKRGSTLEYFTVGYNAVEGLVSIIAGLIAGSVSLVG